MNTTGVSSYAPGSAAPAPALPGGGTGDAAQATLAGTRLVTGARQATIVPLDAFGRQGGPDAAVATEGGLVRVHAVFQMDPATRELTVSVVDEGGRLIRMIPPQSVAQMLAAMATYRGR